MAAASKEGKEALKQLLDKILLGHRVKSKSASAGKFGRSIITTQLVTCSLPTHQPLH